MEVSGGATPAEFAALGTALEVLLGEEMVPEKDPRPSAYRSRWRQAAFEEGVTAGANPNEHRPSWGTT
jgi:hypothetical protein